MSAFISSILVFLAAVAASLPWGLPAKFAFAQPLLPMALVFRLSLGRWDLLPVWVVFLCGLTVDLMTGGPVGFWAVIYLVAHAFAVAVPLQALRFAFFFEWLSFAGAAALLSGLTWLVATFYLYRQLDTQPVISGWLMIVALYPLLSLLIRPARPGRRRNSGEPV